MQKVALLLLHVQHLLLKAGDIGSLEVLSQNQTIIPDYINESHFKLVFFGNLISIEKNDTLHKRFFLGLLRILM